MKQGIDWAKELMPSGNKNREPKIVQYHNYPSPWLGFLRELKNRNLEEIRKEGLDQKTFNFMLERSCICYDYIESMTWAPKGIAVLRSDDQHLFAVPWGSIIHYEKRWCFRIYCSPGPILTQNVLRLRHPDYYKGEVLNSEEAGRVFTEELYKEQTRHL